MAHTPRETANAVRTVVGWLDDHADQLPAGATVIVDRHGAEVGWWPTASTGGLQVERVESLTTVFGPPERLTTSVYWPAEGTRPRLSVYQIGVDR